MRHATKFQNDGGKFSCIFCGYQATQKGNLQIHIRSKHEGLKFSCTNCDYKATQKGNVIFKLMSKQNMKVKLISVLIVATKQIIKAVL